MFVSKDIPTTNTFALHCNAMSSILTLHIVLHFHVLQFHALQMSWNLVRHLHVLQFHVLQFWWSVIFMPLIFSQPQYLSQNQTTSYRTLTQLIYTQHHNAVIFCVVRTRFIFPDTIVIRVSVTSLLGYTKTVTKFHLYHQLLLCRYS